MTNSVTSSSLNSPVVLSLPVTPNSTDLVSVVMDKFQGSMNAKETTLNLQKETLQTIVDDMNLMSDKLDELKDTSNWDSASKPFNYPFGTLIGKKATELPDQNQIGELISAYQQLTSAGFSSEPANGFFASSLKESFFKTPVSSVVLDDKSPKKTTYEQYTFATALFAPEGIYYYDDKPGSVGVKSYYAIIGRFSYDVENFQEFRVPTSQTELTSWNNFSAANGLANPYIYPFSDLVGMPVSDLYYQKLTSLMSANDELRNAGMTLGPPNTYYAETNFVDGASITLFDTPPVKVDVILPTKDGLYFYENPLTYFVMKDGIQNFATVNSFRTPSSQDELTAWNNFISFKQSSTSSNIIFNDSVLLGSKNVNANINVNFNMAFVKQANTTSSPYAYSITAVSPENKSIQPKGTFFYLTDDIKNPKTYYLSSGTGAPAVVPAADISLFIKNPSDSEIQSWRTQYAEKQIQLTQRSTEFQAFLNTTVAEFNTYSDLFTNVLKTIFSSLKDIVSKF